MRYMKINEYSKEHILEAIHNLKDRYYYEMNLFNDDECEIYMNIDTYELIRRINMVKFGFWCKNEEPRKILGLEIKIDNEMEYLTVMIKEREKMKKNSLTITTATYPSTYIPSIKFGLSNIQYHTHDTKLPKEYYINEKKKTIVLKWDDDTITKVKTSKDDKFDARYGFLVAYFQKNCGMSKTKANKYLDNLEKEVK